MPNTIGCPAVDIVFTRRGSVVPVADPIPYQSLTWGRVVDDISSCEADLALSCGLPADLRPGRHEVSVYRDGSRVWVGPLLDITTSGGSTKIIAKDRLWWSTVRLLRADHISTGAPIDAGTLFGQILTDAYTSDNSCGFTWTTPPCGISVERDWPAHNRQVAYEALADLAAAAVDFTVIDGSLRADGVQIAAPAIPSVTNTEFTDVPDLSLTVDTFQNHAAVVGQAAAAVQPYNAEESDPVIATDNYVEVIGDAYNYPSISDFGLIERRYDRGEISDNGSAAAAAQSYLDHAINGVVNFSGTLLPAFPIGITQMIPGAQFDADITADSGLHVIGRFRIQSFTETLTGGEATSNITAIPVGTLNITIR